MKHLYYAPSTIVKLPNIFGDGSDSDVTVSSTITLTRDMNYRNLTITAAGIINTGGFRIFVQNAFTNAGIVQNNATNAVTTTAGNGAPGWSVIAGAGGGAGRTTVGIGTSATSTNVFLAPHLTGVNGQGGAAPANGGGGPGDGGNDGQSTAWLLNIVNAINTVGVNNGELLTVLGPCGGGGGGNASGAGVNAGAGGGGGGFVIIAAKNVNNTGGTIKALGGNGSAATGAGNAGGGGGGQGGYIILIGITIGAGTTTVTGGTAGAAVGTGSAGTAGSLGATIQVQGV